MSSALPEALREYVDQRVRSGQCGNASEYLRELIRRDPRGGSVPRPVSHRWSNRRIDMPRFREETADQSD